MKTTFYVAVFSGDTNQVPVATTTSIAKMPLSAMVFGLQRLQMTRAGRVEVTDTNGEMQDIFYHVVLTSERVTYDRAVLVEEDEP